MQGKIKQHLTALRKHLCNCKIVGGLAILSDFDGHLARKKMNVLRKQWNDTSSGMGSRNPYPVLYDHQNFVGLDLPATYL